MIYLTNINVSNPIKPANQGRQSIPKSGGDRLQTRKVRRYATRNFFLNFGTLKWHSQRFGGTYKVIP